MKQERGNKERFELLTALILGAALLYMAVQARWSLPQFSWLLAEEAPRIRVVVELLMCLGILYCARYILAEGYASLFERRPNAAAMATLSASIALIYSIAMMLLTFQYPEKTVHVQFEWAGCVLALMLLIRKEEPGEDTEPIPETPMEKRFLLFGWICIGLAVAAGIVGVLLEKDVEFGVRITVCMLAASGPFVLEEIVPFIYYDACKIAGKCGIHLKSEKVIEDLTKVDVLVLDKTGTLLEGNPEVRTCIPFGCTRQELLYLAVKAEGGNSHPYAKAVQTAYENTQMAGEFEQMPESFELAENIQGEFAYRSGLGARLTQEEEDLCIGNFRWMEQCEVKVEVNKKLISQMMESGQTPVFVAKNKALIGVLGISDRFVKDAKRRIQQIHAFGIRTVMLTGDHQVAAEYVGRMLGFDEVLDEIAPEEKADTVRKLQEGGAKVILVADGGMDASALLAADISCVYGEINESLQDDMEIEIRDRSFGNVYGQFALAREAAKIKKQTFWMGFLYQLFGISLSCGICYYTLGVLVSPLAAAFYCLAANCILQFLAGRLEKLHW